jgi:hypothetical protein
MAGQQFALGLHFDQQTDVVESGEPVTVFHFQLAARQIQPRTLTGR